MGNTLDDTLSRALRCEASSRRLYLELAAGFGAVPEASAFFEDLARDEQLHVALLASLRDQLPAEALAGPAPPRLLESVTSLEALMADDPGAQVTTLEDAYQLAHQLESLELFGAFQVAAVSLLPEALRDAYLTAQIDEHLEKLPAFGHAFPVHRRRAIAVGTRPDTD